uniref:Secreted protein n=1 Tax=Eutreptiella gymnastica TaxID=73025 RepID=A0A7S1JGV2_9EUGL|mmetsp:Transcript_96905/g.167111  ORF Transcript_96905/g.167111 Transcript_96905/m.167111 type:complete len:146 (+) Transcript_96905:179-616(+)
MDDVQRRPFSLSVCLSVTVSVFLSVCLAVCPSVSTSVSRVRVAIASRLVVTCLCCMMVDARAKEPVAKDLGMGFLTLRLSTIHSKCRPHCAPIPRPVLRNSTSEPEHLQLNCTCQTAANGVSFSSSLLEIKINFAPPSRHYDFFC